MPISACGWHGNRNIYGKVIFLSTWLSHWIILISLWGCNYFTGEETQAGDSELTEVIQIINDNGSYLNSSLIISFMTFSENTNIIPCFLMGLLWKVKVLHKLYKDSQINFILFYIFINYYNIFLLLTIGINLLFLYILSIIYPLFCDRGRIITNVSRGKSEHRITNVISEFNTIY